MYSLEAEGKLFKKVENLIHKISHFNYNQHDASSPTNAVTDIGDIFHFFLWSFKISLLYHPDSYLPTNLPPVLLTFS